MGGCRSVCGAPHRRVGRVVCVVAGSGPAVDPAAAMDQALDRNRPDGRCGDGFGHDAHSGYASGKSGSAVMAGTPASSVRIPSTGLLAAIRVLASAAGSAAGMTSRVT